MYGAYRIRVSFGVLLSRDFSRLPQMKSLLSGYCSIRNFNAIAGPPVFECKFKKKTEMNDYACSKSSFQLFFLSFPNS